MIFLRRLLFLLPLALVAPPSAQEPPTDRSQIGRPKVASGAASRLDGTLQAMVAQRGMASDADIAALAPISRESAVAVAIRVVGSPAAVAAAAASTGALVANVGSDTIEAYVPVSALTTVANLPGVGAVQALFPPLPLVTSQGAVAHNAANWHPSNFRGAGIKVGIIDTGFLGYTALIGAELPAPAAVRCWTAIGVFTTALSDCDRADNHGTAVAEALVDVAPLATLYLSNPLSPADVRTTVEWMAAQGVKVINHSAAWLWDGPGDGTSPFATSPVNTVKLAESSGRGIVWVNAAGNHNLSTWRGPYSDVDGNTNLEFGPGLERNPVVLAAGERLTVQMRWQDAWPGATRDLDLFLLNAADQQVAVSLGDQAGGAADIPRETFDYIPTVAGTYRIVMGRGTPGTAPAWVHIQAHTQQPLGIISSSHSIVNPAESASNIMLATGAARWSTTAVIEPVSSRGPTNDSRIKPDLVGADGGDSATLGPGGFFGTSQAAPHVAGLAAVVLSRFPGMAGSDVVTFLKTNALPRETAPNNTWGSGFAFLPTLTDTDGDGLPDFWEQQFGLDFRLAAGADGANGDPDGDGVTNAQELQQGTHPRGVPGLARYFAEGATSATFFDASFALVNPSATTAANVLMRFLKDDGLLASQYLNIPALGRRTVVAKGVGGLEVAAFSTVIETDVQVVADRTMTWDSRGYGSHAETNILAPSTDWYLAEGATHSGFNLFYLIQNPNTQAATVTVTYLLGVGAPVQKTYTVPANTRFNIWVNNEAATLLPLANENISARLQSNVPVIVERAMYLNSGGLPFGAGHDSAGIVAPALTWFLAEGATGDFFDLFVLVANPNPTAADISVRFLFTTGPVITRTYRIAPNSRFNIYVDDQAPELRNAAVSTTVTVTNNVPVIVERAMWWPGPTAATWHEAHNSPGVTQTGTKWALAEGENGGARSVQTYILVANTSNTASTVKVTLLFEDGTRPERSFLVPATSRFTVDAGAEFAVPDGRKFGAIIESLDGAQIVVERAMYSNAGGVVWAAGTNALATRLP